MKISYLLRHALINLQTLLIALQTVEDLSLQRFRVIIIRAALAEKSESFVVLNVNVMIRTYILL